MRTMSFLGGSVGVLVLGCVVAHAATPNELPSNMGQSYLSLTDYSGGYSRYFGDRLTGPGVRLSFELATHLFVTGSYAHLTLANTGIGIHREGLGVGYVANPTGWASAYVETEFIRSTLHPPQASRVDDYWKIIYGIRQSINRTFEVDFGLYTDLNQHWGARGFGAELGVDANWGPLQLGAGYDHNSDVNALLFHLRWFW
ncbi:MAG: hypothetical protein ACYCS1_00970 [Gammaproteobacteria bacterium]